MALNLTPRHYNVDWTGRDAVIDPAPLLRAQEKSFQTQKETMNMVYETGRKGMEFAEYLGARQQLGRVKAQLSELDPNDPEFHRRLSSIIADNPLALENPNTAPGLKMAIAPLTTQAGLAAKHRYDLENITASYGGREGLQDARFQGQRDAWLFRRDNAPLTDADKLGLNGSAPPLPEEKDITSTPQSVPFGVGFGTALQIPVPGSAPGVNGPDLTDTPVGPSGGGGPPLLPDIPASGDLGAGKAEAVAIHQAANEAASREAATLPPGVRRGNDGALYERKSVGKSSTWVPYKVAPDKPTTPLPEGKAWVPQLHEGTNEVKGWKAMAAPKLSEQSQSRVNNYVKQMGAEDPQMMALTKEIDGATADFELAKTRLRQAEKAGDPDTISVATTTVDNTRQTLLDLQRQQVSLGVKFHNEALRVLDPKFAEDQRRFNAAVEGRDSVLQTPAAASPAAIPAPSPRPPATIGEKLDGGLSRFK